VEAAAAAATAAVAAKQTAGAPPKAVSKLLPLEFLDSDSEDGTPKKASKKAKRTPETTISRGQSATRPRKPKAHPRDRQQGTTVYRLLADGGPKTLAPKMGKTARNMKLDLQARRRVGKPVGGGFLRR
jgi:hypothetical protein